MRFLLRLLCNVICLCFFRFDARFFLFVFNALASLLILLLYFVVLIFEITRLNCSFPFSKNVPLPFFSFKH